MLGWVAWGARVSDQSRVGNDTERRRVFRKKTHLGSIHYMQGQKKRKEEKTSTHRQHIYTWDMHNSIDLPLSLWPLPLFPGLRLLAAKMAGTLDNFLSHLHRGR